MKKNKSKLTAICIIFGIVLFFVLSFMISGNTSEPPKVNVSIDEWYSETQKDEYVITVIGQTTCPNCKAYKPIISSLSTKYKLNLYFFESDMLEEEEYNKLVSSYEEFDHEYVPFTAITKNGKVLTTTVGKKEKDELLEFLKEYGVIKN